MKIIKIKDKKILVDDQDFEWLNKYNWCISKGYIIAHKPQSGKKGTTISIHRLIMNTPKNIQTDHINGNKLDNRRENLRICSRSENNMNRHKVRGKSKYKGVGWFKQTQCWQAYISKNYKIIHLGLFKSEKEAAKAYNQKAKELFGEFALLNILI